MSLAPVIHPVGSNSSHPWPSTVEDPHRVNNVLRLQLWHSLPVNEIRLIILSSLPALFKEPSGVVSSSLRSPRLAIHVDHAAQDDSLLDRGRESNGKEKAETCCLGRHCHSTASLQAWDCHSTASILQPPSCRDWHRSKPCLQPAWPSLQSHAIQVSIYLQPSPTGVKPNIDQWQWWNLTRWSLLLIFGIMCWSSIFHNPDIREI